MKIIYTEQALCSLQEVLDFVAPNVTEKKLIEIRDSILDAADTLLLHPHQGQTEPFLEHLGLSHRRLIVGHNKIIYSAYNGTLLFSCITNAALYNIGITSRQTLTTMKKTTGSVTDYCGDIHRRRFLPSCFRFTQTLFVPRASLRENDGNHKVLGGKGMRALCARIPFPWFTHYDLVISTTYSMPVEKGGEIS